MELGNLSSESKVMRTRSIPGVVTLVYTKYMDLVGIIARVEAAIPHSNSDYVFNVYVLVGLSEFEKRRSPFGTYDAALDYLRRYEN